jgi:hypothetical protein
MLVSNLCMPGQQIKTYGKCVTQICIKSRNNSIVKYDTRHIYLWTSRKYFKKGEIWKSTGHWPVELENLCLTLLWVSVRLWCCRLLVDEVHFYSLSLHSFDSCLFYGVPVVWGSAFYLYVCFDASLFNLILGLHAFRVVRILYIYKIKTKTINGRVSVYKQMVGLYVINN